MTQHLVSLIPRKRNRKHGVPIRRCGSDFTGPVTSRKCLSAQGRLTGGRPGPGAKAVARLPCSSGGLLPAPGTDAGVPDRIARCTGARASNRASDARKFRAGSRCSKDAASACRGGSPLCDPWVRQGHGPRRHPIREPRVARFFHRGGQRRGANFDCDFRTRDSNAPPRGRPFAPAVGNGPSVAGSPSVALRLLQRSSTAGPAWTSPARSGLVLAAAILLQPQGLWHLIDGDTRPRDPSG